MQYRYILPSHWIEKVSNFEEFANGAAQVSVRTRDGRLHKSVLISNSTFIVAMRDHDDLPFRLEDMEDIFQAEEDRNPKSRGGWKYWDSWD
jgi:hypothetical protein